MFDYISRSGSLKNVLLIRKAITNPVVTDVVVDGALPITMAQSWSRFNKRAH